MQRTAKAGRLGSMVIARLFAAAAFLSAATGAAGVNRTGLSHRDRSACRYESQDDPPLPRPPRPHPVDSGEPTPQTAPSRAQPVEPKADRVETRPALDTLGPDRSAVKRGARQFKTLVDQRRVRLLNDERDRAQVDNLCAEGQFLWLSPAAPNSATRRSAPDPEILEPLAGFDGPDRDQKRLPARGRVSRAVPSAPILPPDAQTGFPDRTSVRRAPAAATTQYSTAPPIELFTMLNALASHSTADKPLCITSLLRPPFKTARYSAQSPTNPHALGIAVDIAAYGGHVITTADPEEEVQACLALIHALVPGRYRMGLPKAPEPPRAPANGDPAALPGFSQPRATRDEPDLRTGGSLNGGATISQDAARRPDPQNSASPDPQTLGRADGPLVDPTPWPFFPPPQKGYDAQGKPVTLFANEHYVDEQFINDVRLRKAITDARRRGVDFIALFPDGVNHIHVDVKQVR